MRTVWKYPLKVTDRQILTVPNMGRFLTAQLQDGELVLWAEGNSSAVPVVRQIAIIGTGRSAEPGPGAEHLYIATVQMPPYAWHIYEVVSAAV